MKTYNSILKKIIFYKAKIKELRKLLKTTKEAKEKLRLYNNRYSKLNPICKKIYYEKNKDHLQMKAKEWRLKNKEKIKDKNKKWHENNKKRSQENHRKWYLANQEYVKMKRKERYRLKKIKELKENEKEINEQKEKYMKEIKTQFKHLFKKYDIIR